MFALRLILPGQKFTFYALEEGNKCELIEFLNEMEEKDRRILLGRMERDANQGPARGKERTRDVGGQVFELKCPSVRVLWFYDAGRMIIGSHGFFKGSGKIQDREIEKAQQRRVAYMKQKDQKGTPEIKKDP